jgi:hypothetical protein
MRRSDAGSFAALAPAGLAVRVAVVLVSVVAALLMAGTTARAGTWSIDSLPSLDQYELNGSGTLYDVSCPSASFCDALGIDYTTNSEPSFDAISQGPTWTRVPGPTDPERQISCSAPTFCMAVGDIHAAVWNGVSWSSVPVPAPHGGVFPTYSSVSCSGTTCVAVGTLSQSEAATAQVWRNGTPAKTAPPLEQLSPNSVYCVSALRCIAVGLQLGCMGTRCKANYGPFGESWNGRSWSAMNGPKRSGFDATGLSCLSMTWCMSVSGDGRSARWNGRTWSLSSKLTYHTGDPQIGYRSVSCSTTTSCEAVGWVARNPGHGKAVMAIAAQWDGSTWANEPVPDNGARSSQLESVACPSASSCTAVGVVYPTQETMLPLAESWQP